ncbi:hypothetical protein ACF0H5_017437 [Mactra antiquata]
MSETFNELIAYKPQYVFMNIRGNSFNDITTPHEVYMDIVRIVEELHAAGVQKIFIASIIERGHCTKFTGINSGSFNKMRNAVNGRLKKHFYGDEHAEFIQIGIYFFIASITERGHCPKFTGINSGSFNKMRNAVNRRLKKHFYGDEHAEFIQIGIYFL